MIGISVTDFVAPLEPTGSLDASFSPRLEEDAMREGARLHQRIQKRLAKEEADLQAEVPLSLTVEREGFAMLVRGRLDVLLPGILEEIKTTLQPAPLLRRLALEPDHIYAQQARMYAWMHHALTGEVLACRLRVVSILDGAETLVDVPFDPEVFGAFVEAQLEAHHAKHLRELARAEARREIGQLLSFPFSEPRPGQKTLMAKAAEALARGERLLAQAPTGLGKTAALLYPALEKALAEHGRVFYATPRNSQHGVAEAFVRRLREAGHGVASVTVRAKEKVCPQEEVHCTPDACPRALGYYDRLKASGAVSELMAQGCADAAAVADVADRHRLCPFELSLDAALEADVVIGDYNYAFSPNASLQRFFGSPEAAARMTVLVDEAHNLPARAQDWFSPCLDRAALEALGRIWKGTKAGSLRRRFKAQLKRCLALLDAIHEEGPSPVPCLFDDSESTPALRPKETRPQRRDGIHREVTVEPGPFFGEEQRLGKLLAQAAAEGAALTLSHPLVQLDHAWRAFCSVLRDMGPVHRLTWIPPGRLQITCLDASAHLGARLQELGGAVLFSATLKPFPFYARLSGLDEAVATAVEVASPFPTAHRRVLIVPQISTLFRRRSTEIPRIADFLNRVLPLRHGNYLIFFPSFAFLDAVAPLLDLPGFTVACQPRKASAEALDHLLATLRETQGAVVLAVMGGSLSEGIDLPGEALVGCVVVGPPLPPFDLERRLAKEHFDAQGLPAEAYAYIYPAMARAVQAAGRVIRTPEDRGLLIFLDGRFLEPDYAACFPEHWFREGPREAVSGAILRDVAAFWDSGSAIDAASDA